MLRRRFDWIVLIDTSIKHICLRIPCLPPVGWSHFDLIEVVVSIMVALRASFMQTVYFGAFHLYFIFAVRSQFHFVRVAVQRRLEDGSGLFRACLLLLWLNVYV